VRRLGGTLAVCALAALSTLRPDADDDGWQASVDRAIQRN